MIGWCVVTTILCLSSFILGAFLEIRAHEIVRSKNPKLRPVTVPQIYTILDHGDLSGDRDKKHLIAEKIVNFVNERLDRL